MSLSEMRLLFEMHAGMCQALANPHRLAIMYALKDGEKCVGDIAAELDISVHNVSQHLRILRQGLLVRPRKEGQTVYYSVTNAKLMEACALIREALLEEHQSEGQSLQAAILVDPIGSKDGSESGRQHILAERKKATIMTDDPVDLGSLRGDKVVDARGTSCPGPLLAAKKGMADVKVGEIMEVYATDSGTQKDLPAWAKKMGHEYLGLVEEAGYAKLFVRKLK
jgi:TusA-related sulfurtransferase/DNA-binding transcriptional ArsR family regulator